MRRGDRSERLPIKFIPDPVTPAQSVVFCSLTTDCFGRWLVTLLFSSDYPIQGHPGGEWRKALRGHPVRNRRRPLMLAFNVINSMYHEFAPHPLCDGAYLLIVHKANFPAVRWSCVMALPFFLFRSLYWVVSVACVSYDVFPQERIDMHLVSGEAWTNIFAFLIKRSTAGVEISAVVTLES